MFGLLFGIFIHFNVESGEKAEILYTYKVLSFWWLSLTSLYLYFISETCQGKSKDSTNIKKIIIMVFPTFFVLMAIYVTTKFIKIT